MPYTRLNDDNDAGYANINQGNLFFYGIFPAANWYFDLTVWGGYYHSKNVRKIAFTKFPESRATSKIHGWQLAPHLEIGYNHALHRVKLEPFTMVDYVACWEHRANESGPSPLNFGQKGKYCSLVKSETGLRIQEELHYTWGTVTFMEKASYAYQKAFHTGRINAFLIGSPGSFTVTTLIAPQNMGVAELEALIAPYNKTYYANLTFQAQATSKYQSYQGTLEIGKDF